MCDQNFNTKIITMQQIKSTLRVFLLLFVSTIPAFSQTISIQGVLRDENRRAVSDGFYKVVFNLYDQADGGTSLWSETYNSLETKHGLFTANLGSINSLEGLAFDTTYYVGVTVESFAEMTPRIQLTIYPYAKSLITGENEFPAIGDVTIKKNVNVLEGDFNLAKGSFQLDSGELKLIGPDGKIRFNDGTFINTAEFGGPAGSLANNSAVTINADKDDSLADGNINFEIAGTTKARINNGGALDLFEIGGNEGGETNYMVPTGFNESVEWFGIDAFQNNMRFYNFDVSPSFLFREIMRFDSIGQVGVSYASPTSRLHISNFDGFSLGVGDGSALTLGNDDNLNMVFDASNIQGRNNGVASNLGLNPLGGQVHIGALTPDLSILYLGRNDVAEGILEVYGDGTTQEGGELRLFNSAAHDDLNDFWWMQSFEDDLILGNANGTSPFGEVMRFNHLGLTGIGYAAPTSRLHVSNFSGVSLGGGSALTLGNDNNLNLVFDAANIQARNNGVASPLYLNALGGSVNIGQSDVIQGNLVLHGPATGDDGGEIRLHTSGAYDGTVDYWYLDAWRGQFRIGSVAGADRFTIDELGRVGIGSAFPNGAKLVVRGTGGTVNRFNFFTHDTPETHLPDWGSRHNTGHYSADDMAIRTETGGILTPWLHIDSDIRIKKDIRLSDNQSDLDLINQIEIVDYSLIDSISTSKNKFKKVIAQQVNEVYPLATSLTSDYVPNVYVVASKVTPKKNGTVRIELPKAHDFKEGDNIHLITKEEDLYVTVNSVLSKRSFTISTEKTFDEVFVFGKKVDDFMTVDYEAISMLNVSATQELAKRVEDQEKRISELEKENSDLKSKLAKVDALEAKLNEILKQKAKPKTAKEGNELASLSNQ